MTPGELQQYLHDHIPLSSAMQVSVIEASTERVMLGAPLAPNINHRDTVFGGSASALAILAAWSLLHIRLTAAGINTRLVIQRNTMNYTRAVEGDFTAMATSPSAEDWHHFMRMLRRKGRARITVSSNIFHAAQEAGKFEGEFVALDSSPASANPCAVA